MALIKPRANDSYSRYTDYIEIELGLTICDIDTWLIGYSISYKMLSL